jgi:hypothetical protein
MRRPFLPAGFDQLVLAETLQAGMGSAPRVFHSFFQGIVTDGVNDSCVEPEPRIDKPQSGSGWPVSSYV